jgi:hypothetical protein
MPKKHGAVGAVCERLFKSTEYSAPCLFLDKYKHGAVGAGWALQ